MSSEKNNSISKFGTFDGVFTPCTLTILGVIMFLRVGQVVGQSGLVYAVIIVLLSKSITTLTTLSLSAIATNTRVKGGGAYYLISRSLGVEFGGAIGVVFYCAQAISVAMYVIGFTEAFVASFPSFASDFTSIATVVNIVTFICVYVGAGWTLKIQGYILIVLILSVLTFIVGALGDFSLLTLKANMEPRYQEGESFFSMFALFFPAVTGIMAGANMSGDLKNPARSIPRGTLYSILFTAAIYLVQVVLLAGSSSSDALNNNSLIMQDISVIPALIIAGVFAATLSSALGSMMGAPRILQALARDNIFSALTFFSAGSGTNNEPRRAVVLTFLVAQLCILLGDLNAIAPIITMFFMITYGLLNVATFYEAVTQNPSYRPTFRYCHWSQSLLGALGCLGVMFLINSLWAIIAIVIIFLLHRYIKRHEIEAHWGDLQSGYAFERARKSLLRLEDESYHPKNWRPNVLALSGSTTTRPHLAMCGSWLTSKHGVLTIAQVVLGSLEEHAERRKGYMRTLRKFISKQGLQAFPAIVVSEDLSRGIESLVQCHGIGGMQANTVLLGWPNDDRTAEPFGHYLRLITRMKRSVICTRFLDYRRDSDLDDDGTGARTLTLEAPSGSIDVWWRGKSNGELMVTLAHLLKNHPEWRDNTIRVLRIVGSEEGRAEVHEHIVEVAAAARINVEPVVLVSTNIADTIHKASADAAVVIFGFQAPEKGGGREFYQRMEDIVGELPRVLFVNSAGGVELES
jgi:amino acid transporter